MVIEDVCFWVCEEVDHVEVVHTAPGAVGRYIGGFFGNSGD